jgi:hypothetical protein
VGGNLRGPHPLLPRVHLGPSKGPLGRLVAMVLKVGARCQQMETLQHQARWASSLAGQDHRDHLDLRKASSAAAKTTPCWAMAAVAIAIATEAAAVWVGAIAARATTTLDAGRVPRTLSRFSSWRSSHLH